MKNKKKPNPFLRIFVLVSALLLIAVATAIGMFCYIFGISEPEGLSLASWPDTFTDSFSAWMEIDNGNIKIEKIGLERLNEYGLWIQVIDETGQEVFCYNKPENYPTSYSASELIALPASAYKQGNTVFANSYEDSGKTWSYLVGFPYAIGKYMLYYNGGNVGRLSPLFRMGIFFALCAIVLFMICYGFWLTRHLGKITKGIGNISLRSYTSLPDKGVFSEIYGALNKMDVEVRHSDKVLEDTERVRSEWIANITHDLKTPLSPVKGYAELLTDSSVTEKETMQEYGSIILKNVNHAEKLINDLKLTYQLDSGSVPYNPKEIRLVRFLKECIIDIVNDPTFSNRTIEFKSDMPELTALLDPDLYRRAVQNIIINALIHNPSDKKVTITVDSVHENGVYILIRDNGVGMSNTEQSELFNRYYIGTNTKEKPEGSGLGLAIANQIVMLHGGDITVKSKLNEGTEFAIFLPLENK